MLIFVGSDSVEATVEGLLMAANEMLAPQRQFVPQKFDASDWSHIEPLGKALLDRPINSVIDLEKWLLDFSEFSSVLDEYRTRRYIDMSCHTDDPAIEKRYMHYVQNIEPTLKPIDFDTDISQFVSLALVVSNLLREVNLARPNCG